MEHPGEIWQELGYNGERIGGVDPASFDENKVRLLSGVAVMLYRYKDNEVEFLFQHRSKYILGNPDKWDVSVSGHVNMDESKIDAMRREVLEEIGVEINVDKLEFVASYVRWKILINLYFYDWADRDDNFHFDDKEVEEVKWVKYSELEGFLPNLKKVLFEDKMFLSFLDEWNKKILEKNGNL